MNTGRTAVIFSILVASSMTFGQMALADDGVIDSQNTQPSNILNTPPEFQGVELPGIYDEDPVPAPEFDKPSNDLESTTTVTPDGGVQTDNSKIFGIKAEKLSNLGESIVKKHSDLVQRTIKKERDIFHRLSTVLDQINIQISPKENAWTHNDVFGLSVGFAWATAPAYIGFAGDNHTYHYRQDSWIFSTQLNALNPNPWLQKWALFNIRPQVQMDFFQFFNSRQEAQHISHWRKPKDFPTTAAKALNDKLMGIGDVAHIQAQLVAQVGGQHYWQILKELGVAPAIGYLLNGQFDMFIMKAEDNKFHMRLILQRQHGVFGQFSFGVNGNFNPLVWQPLTNALTHLMHLDQMWFGYKFHGDLNAYMADYIIDLKDPDVAKAYDEVMNEALFFQKNDDGKRLVTNLLDPFKGPEDVGGELKHDMKNFDEIYFEDMGKPQADRRVDRNFAGSDFAVDRPNLQHKIGIVGLIRDERTLIHRDNQMINEVMGPDGQDAPEFYSFPTWISTDDFRAAVTYFANRKSRSSNVISKADQNFTPTEFESIGFYYDFTTKRYTESVHQDLIKHYEKILPAAQFSDFTQFLKNNNFEHVNNGLIQNMRISARYFITADGLKAAQKATEGLSFETKVEQMRELLIDHLDRVPKTDRDMSVWHRIFSLRCKGVYAEDDKAKYLCKDVEQIAHNLVIAFDDGVDPKTKLPLISGKVKQQKVEELSANKLFTEVGPGFLMAAIPQEDLDKSAFFEIKFYLPGQKEPLIFPPEYAPAPGQPETHFPKREFYETILDIQNIMSNMQPDMRLPSDRDDLTHRKTKNVLSSEKFN